MDSQILVGDKIDTTSEETSTRVVEVESNKVESINVRPDIKPVRPSVSVQKSAEKKIEDKEDEKVLEKLYKKTLKELKEQLDSCSAEDKVRILEKKYLDKLRDFNKLDRANTRLQGLYDSLQSDMDNISQELSKIKSTKVKLEALCKQLQNQNKDILAECKQAAIEDKERKKEQQERFAKMIQVIFDIWMFFGAEPIFFYLQQVQARIEAHDQERREHVSSIDLFSDVVITYRTVCVQVVENEKLREQLQSFITQYEARDKHFEAQIQAKEAEKVAAEAKQAQVI